MKDWLIALGGTCTVLLVENSGEPFQPEAGFILIMAGFILHFGAKLSLRRSFGIVPADRGIKSNGLYAIVRHPMYCGYIVSHIGFLIAKPSIWNIAVYVVAWTLFIARIRIEERLLSRNEEYRAYCDKVKYRFIPGVF